jgi:iron complex outermembrane receptor protein
LKAKWYFNTTPFGSQEKIKMKNKFLTCVAALLVLPALLVAQNYFRGRVTNAVTGEPLMFASVRVEGTFLGTLTDGNGEFSFDNIVGGDRCCFIVTCVGFKTDTDCCPLPYADQLPIQLTPGTVLEEAVVYSTRANENSAMAYTNVSKEDLQKNNFGQDLPYLLDQLPSVVTTSDAGTGVGYTGIRVRGSDANRVNVTINGIPVNDAESQGTYWVDIPDVVSSTDNIQLQRGVGTSTNGAGAFGGSLNLQTDGVSAKPYGEIMSSGGSFNTFRTTMKAGTGLMENGWSFDGRMSHMSSDGYIDRGSSNLESWYLSGGWYGKNISVKAIAFSGREKTYQCWYGVPQDSLKTNRTYNPAGEYVDANGNFQYYNNETDNYQQDYYQLHFLARANDNWNFNVSLHATKGIGYYEEFRQGEQLSDYGLDTAGIYSDLVRRLWLNNWFYGVTYGAHYDSHKKTELIIGGATNNYEGQHYNEITWAQFLPAGTPSIYRYENDFAHKFDANIFARLNYQVSEKLNLFVDLQFRNVNYHFTGIDTSGVLLPQSAALIFFNPKAGATFRVNEKNLTYVSFSTGNKEPNRDDYVNSTINSRPKPETLHDIELGWKFRSNKISLSANLYYMHYVNQLVLTGKINDVGAYTRENVAKSFREGIEIEAGYNICKSLNISANATYSMNKILDYHDYLDNYDSGGQVVNIYPKTDIAFSPSIISAASLNYKCQKGFSASIMEKYVGKQYLDNTANSSRQIDAYMTTNLRLSYSFKPKFVKEITASVLVNNLFNTKYSSNGYTYGYIYAGEQHYNYYYPQAGINFLGMIDFKF